MTFFTELELTNLKFISNQMTLNGKSNLEKREQNQRYHILRLQTTLQSYRNQNSNIVTKTDIELNGLSPKISPGTYSQSTYNKETRIHNGEKNSLYNKWHLETWTARCKIIKHLTISTK